MGFRLFTLLALFIFTLNVNAQENSNPGISYLNDLQYHKARSFFLAQVKTNPADVLNYCGLGDTYLALNLPDSAKVMFEKGAKLNSKSPFPQIGLGKVALVTGDRMGKVESFEKAVRLDKKNPAVYDEIARGCIGLSKTDTATCSIYLKQGFELNSGYAGFHTTSGDYELLAKRYGKAVNAYERAVYFDPSSALAYRKLGVMQTFMRSYRDAINAFNKCIELNKDQILVYKNLGDLYYLMGRYAEAEKNYQVYLANAEVSTDDKERYSFILFFNKKYDDAAKILEDVISKSSDPSVLLRIQGYIACETGDYQKGLVYMNKFFKQHDPAKNISSDYDYYGRLLQMSGNNKQAIDSYRKAYGLDSTSISVSENLAKLFFSNNSYEESVFFYKRFIDNGGDKVNASFQIGKAYYFEGDKYRSRYDSLTRLQKSGKIHFADSAFVRKSREKYFQMADSAFNEVTLLNPQYAGGYIWRGRINSLLDPESFTESAKISYEKALAILEAGDSIKNRKSIIECYKYLGSYFFLNSERLFKTDKPRSDDLRNVSLDYFRKILILDPADAQALEVFRRLKKPL